MADYPIFSEEGGHRIAINPDSVSSIAESAPGRVTIHLPDGGTVIIPMTLESVIAKLKGWRLGSDES
jgi:hypothetical protein